MCVGTLWIHGEQRCENVSRRLEAILFQIRHPQREVRPLIPGIDLNDTLKFAFRIREVAFSPISPRETVMRWQIIWSLPDRRLKFRYRLLGFVAGKQRLPLCRVQHVGMRMMYPRGATVDQHDSNEKHSHAPNRVIGLWSEPGNERTQK